jgi:hypothetical protein
MLYGNVNNVDVWVGILAEDHLAGKSVGKTMHEILRVQFEKLRDGDFIITETILSFPGNCENRDEHHLRRCAETKYKAHQPSGKCSSRRNVRALLKKKPQKSICWRLVSRKVFRILLQESLRLTWTTAPVQGTIKIFNSTGVLSRTLAVAQGQRSLQLNVSDAEGTYIINISAGKVIATLKLVKVSN